MDLKELAIGQTVVVAREEHVDELMYKGTSISIYKKGNKFRYEFGMSQGGPQDSGYWFRSKDEAKREAKKALREDY